MEDFIAVELSSERRARIERNPADALVTTALTFASPTLVPRDLFKDLPADALLEGIHDEILGAVMTLAAHIAAQLRDVRLADLVADFSIEACASNPQQKSVTEVVFRVVECAAANTDREEARIALARRFEGLAFLLPQAVLTTFSELLITLQMLDDGLAIHLGRAIAIARLGIPRIAA